MIIQREIKKRCLELFTKYPVLTITGPRQSGKTTLSTMIFKDKPYFNLEEPDTRSMAIDDPRSFLDNCPAGAVIDEIQRAPNLVSYIQSFVDQRKKNGMFVLTGSQNFELSNTINQSLAGRSAVIKLLPFSFRELAPIKNLSLKDPDNIMLNGFYPRIYKENMNPADFYMHYFETYIERDLRQLSQIDNLHLFEKFVRITASRTGSLLNYSNLANDLGVSQPTVSKWISILEASFIVFLLQPYHANIGKRLIKTPKIYFFDTGLLSYLLGINKYSELKSHPLRGNIFENFIISDIIKSKFNNVKPLNLYFFRDRTGNEVDLISDSAGKLDVLEIKSAKTYSRELFKGIKKLEQFMPGKIERSTVLYCGSKEAVTENVHIKNWKTFLSGI